MTIPRYVAPLVAGLVAGGLIGYALHKRTADREAAQRATLEPAAGWPTAAADVLEPAAATVAPAPALEPLEATGTEVTRVVMKWCPDLVGSFVRHVSRQRYAHAVRAMVCTLTAALAAILRPLTYGAVIALPVRVRAILPAAERLTVRPPAALEWLCIGTPARGPNAGSARRSPSLPGFAM